MEGILCNGIMDDIEKNRHCVMVEENSRMEKPTFIRTSGVQGDVLHNESAYPYFKSCPVFLHPEPGIEDIDTGTPKYAVFHAFQFCDDDLGKIGPGYFQGFMNRNKHRLVSKRGHK